MKDYISTEGAFFSGLDAIEIDIANSYGLDKELWVHRLLFVELNWDRLEQLAVNAKDKLLCIKAVKALRRAMKGEAIGHNIHLDATNSGLQIFAALSGCLETASACNLWFRGNIKDAYKIVAEAMCDLVKDNSYTDRDECKKPVMTKYYNKQKPEFVNKAKIPIFEKAIADKFPGAEAVMDIVNGYWNPDTEYHTWTLPDGHVASVPVLETYSDRIEIDKFDHCKVTIRYEDLSPNDSYLPLVPNFVQSVDAYLAREVTTRANYNKELVEVSQSIVNMELSSRKGKLTGIRQNYCIGLLPSLTVDNVKYYSTRALEGFRGIIEECLSRKPFEIWHVHDSFSVHPNNMTTTMKLYRAVMVEIAESNMLNDFLSELSGKQVNLKKFTNKLPELIKKSQYAIC